MVGNISTRGQLGQVKLKPKTDALGQWRIMAVQRFTPYWWSTKFTNEMVLCLWRPARQSDAVSQASKGSTLSYYARWWSFSYTSPDTADRAKKEGYKSWISSIKKTSSTSISTNGPLKRRSWRNSPQEQIKKENSSVACIQETHLNGNRIIIRGYQIFRLDRLEHKGSV